LTFVQDEEKKEPEKEIAKDTTKSDSGTGKESTATAAVTAPADTETPVDAVEVTVAETTPGLWYTDFSLR
jgi:hypothetical protein